MAFIGIVSAAQFAFDKKPRLASAVTGSVCFVLIAVVSMALDRESNFDPDIIWIFGWIWTAFLGAIAGYVTGTMIGGVFLMMAAANAVFGNRPDDRQA